MKEEKDKKYNIILGLMIFFFILLVGVAVAFGLGVISISGTNENSAGDPASEQESLNTKDSKGSVNEKNLDSKSIVDKSQYIVDYIDINEYKGKCQQGDCDLYLKAKLPKLALNTEAASSINSEIKDLYINMNEYYKQDFTNATGKNGKYISYYVTSNSGYVNRMDCIYICINQAIDLTHATGVVKHITLLYLVDADKRISVSDLLNTYGITMDKIINKLKENSEFLKLDAETRSSIANRLYSHDDIFVDKITENEVYIGVDVGPGSDDIVFAINY